MHRPGTRAALTPVILRRRAALRQRARAALQVELAGGNRAAMTTAVFAQYCAAPIVLTGTLTFIVTMLELYT